MLTTIFWYKQQSSLEVLTAHIFRMWSSCLYQLLHTKEWRQTSSPLFNSVNTSFAVFFNFFKSTGNCTINSNYVCGSMNGIVQLTIKIHNGGIHWAYEHFLTKNKSNSSLIETLFSFELNSKNHSVIWFSFPLFFRVQEYILIIDFISSVINLYHSCYLHPPIVFF